MIVNHEELTTQLMRAIDGDSFAMQTVLREYDPLFRNRSVIKGAFDEDCYQYILLRVIQETPKFKGIKIFFPKGEETE